MLVGEIMNRHVFKAAPEMSMREAARIMADNRVGSIVVEKNGRMSGIVTEHDILLAVAESKEDFDSLAISGIMTRYVIYISPDAKIEKAAELMISRGIKKLPVIENDKIQGIITTSDIVAAEPELMKSVSKLMTYQDNH